MNSRGDNVSVQSTPASGSAFTDSVIVVQPRRGWNLVDLADLWRYRELLWILALRDIKVRYKQTVVGAAWAIIQPLTTMLIFTVLFKQLGRIPAESGPVPYAVTTYCGLLPWLLFSNSVSQSSESLVTNRNLITKVYFPRVIIPIAPIVSALIDFGIAFVVLLGLMAWYGITPGWAVFMLPLYLLLAITTAFAMGLWLSALNAVYRDLRYAVPFLLQVGFFVSPVVFETSALVPDEWRLLYSINPMVGVLDGFRWALLGKAPTAIEPLLISMTAVAVLLLTGLVYFRRMERLFADRI